MKMKLYTADAIKEQMHKLLCQDCQDCGETDYCPKCDYRELIDQILDAPTVDAVPTDFHDKCMQIEIEKRFGMEEVVRCKDCTSYQEGFRGDHWCTKHSSAYSIMQWGIEEDDYCSWAERREDA